MEKSLFLGNATQVTHRPLAIEIVGLPGGHNYDVWIEACVEDECQAGKSKVVTIMCEHKCSDGTCLHWNAKCNYVRECPDGSDEQVNIRESLFTKGKNNFILTIIFRIVRVIHHCISDVITGIAYHPGDNAMVSMIVMTNLMSQVVHLVLAMKNSDARRVASVC